MLPTVHAVVLAVLLLWPGAAEGPDPIARDTTTLQFFGFRAGASLDELSARLASLSGGRLRCKRAKLDPSVNECRAVLQSAELGRVDVWVSAIDSMAGGWVVGCPGGVDRGR